MWWCQGYSEPGAGSDLASLRTQCVDKGDHFLVNGQKIWTSGAQFADMCFALVRTDNTKKHEGISFLLIDMKSPGVEVRPIKLISGNSPFCETFFTDVKVPKENLMGPLNGGWTIGKRLLQFERAGLGGGVGGGGLNRGGETRSLDQVAKHYIGSDEKGRIADADLARPRDEPSDGHARLHADGPALDGRSQGQFQPQLHDIDHEECRVANRAGTRRSSCSRSWATRVWAGTARASPRDELDTVRGWLGGKATTIYGGSAEIQNNIISKRVLGLLDHQ